jgi:glyoxylase-like metal-dependent hydrolase (beta-lactamase superfamily II)
VTRVAEGVWVVEIPLPSANPPTTSVYAIEDARGDLHLVDAGWDLPGNLETLATALESIGSALDRVRTVTVTHLHPDHLGLAGAIRDATGARVQLHAREQHALDARPVAPDLDGWGIPDEVRDSLLSIVGPTRNEGFAADVLLRHDDILEIPGRSIRVLHTPGHTVGHLVLSGPDLLFTGDLLLPTIFPGIGVGGVSPDPLGDYLRSLDLIETLGDPLVLPGHGPAFRGLAARVTETRAHQVGRTEQVARLVHEHPDATVWEVASRVTWTAGWEALSGFHLASALSQTAMRMRYINGNETGRRTA